MVYYAAMARVLVVFFAIAVACCATADEPSYITFPADVPWVTRTSDHFQIIYRSGEERLAARTLSAAECAHRLLDPIFPAGPEKTWIVVADFHDATNGYALTFPYEHMVIFAAPPDAVGQLNELDDWLGTVVLHEYVHIRHIYPAKGLWKIARAIFGSAIVPNGMMPSHFHEGMAVLFETQFSGRGRGRSTNFEMSRRMAVDAGTWDRGHRPLDRMDGTLTVWPHGTSAYFYGWYLSEELWKRKGQRGIYSLVDSYSDNWPYFVNTPLRQVYGTDFATLWDEIFLSGTNSGQKEIARIKNEGLTDLKYFTKGGYSKWDIAVSPDGSRIAYRQSDPKEGLRLLVQKTGSPSDIEDTVDRIDVPVHWVEGLCWGKHPTLGEQLIYVSVTNKDNYSTHSLSRASLSDKKSESLKAEKPPDLSHVQQLACSPDLQTLLIYVETSGKGEVRELKYQTDKYQITRRWSVPEATWISGLAVGESHWIGVRRGTTTQLMKWDAKTEPVAVADIPAHAYSFRMHAGQLYAITPLEGRDEVWRLDPSQKIAQKKISILGGVNSFGWVGEQLVVSSYQDGGYDLATATPIDREQRHKLLEPSSAPLDVAPAVPMGPVENYSPLGTLFPRMWFPQALFVPDGFQIGAYVPGFDLSQRHFYDVFGGYDSRGLGFARLNYRYRISNSATFSVEPYLLPSYLIANKAFLKTWGANAGMSFAPGHGLPDLHTALLFKRLEPSAVLGPGNQSVGASLGLSYELVARKQKPLDVSPRRGSEIGVNHAQYFQAVGSTNDYFATTAYFKQYFGAPWWDSHMFFLGLQAGYTEGSTLFNSYFQGGGELLFSQARGFFLNRAFQAGSFVGRRVLNANFEYRFPIATIERGPGLLPFFLKDIHAALVADVLTYDRGLAKDRSYRDDFLFKLFYASVGAELKTDWTALFYIPTQLRVGAYHGFGGTGGYGPTGDFRPNGESLYFSIGLEAGL